MQKNDSWIILAILLVGLPIFLLMDKPWIFWLAYVPLAILFVGLMAVWIKTGGLGYIVTSMIAFIAIVILAVVAVIPEKCEHEDMVTVYSFRAYDETAYSSTRPYCRDCKEQFQHTLIKGTLVDQSYLEAIQEYSDGREIIPGEYYTVTATAPSGYTGSSRDKLMITCRVENEDYIVSFSAEFREEFKELVRAVEEGDEITFRGRFYDEGCGFTDCELIEK